MEHPGTQLALYYGDYCLGQTDLSMGFGQVKNKKYLRFPYWIITTFAPEADEQQIRDRIREINEDRYEKSNECVLINKHVAEQHPGTLGRLRERQGSLSAHLQI